MESFDTIIKNGTLITPEGNIISDLGIADGTIKTISKNGMNDNAAQVFDAQGLTILPGLVDMHVHINDPGRTEWEDWEHATKAAAAGGITTVVDMPVNSSPALTNIESMELKKRTAKNSAYVDYMFWGGLTNENADEIPQLQNAGIKAFKAFMSASGISDFSSAGNEALLSGLEKTAGTSSFIGVHAESESIASYLAGKLKSEKRNDPLAWVESRPVACEVEAINRFLALIATTGGNGHICHVTSADGARLINEAQKRGLPVTFETCASYLTFTQEDFEKAGPILKCAPPLRSPENLEALWMLVKNGAIPIVTSDHSPCTRELKERGNDNIWAAWGGISGIQTTLYTMLTEGVHKRNLTLGRLAKACCENPAKRMGLTGRKGTITIGAEADLAIVDLSTTWTLTPKDIYTKNILSPLINKQVCGKVVATYLRGNKIYDSRKSNPFSAPSGKLIF